MGAPSVRLAYNPGPIDAYGALAPSVRLAVTIKGGAMSADNLARAINRDEAARPDVRLAYHPTGECVNEALGPRGDDVDLRLAATTAMMKAPQAKAEARYPFTMTEEQQMSETPEQPPTVRLAHEDRAQGTNCLAGERGVERLPDDSRPALLVSYVYLGPFLKNRHKYAYRNWVMDSGAFSAHNSGQTIELQAYIDKCLELMESDDTLCEIFSLDVIGDWRGSLRNTEEMWKRGVPAIPCFHAGSPWEALIDIARDYPKIALGGVALARARKKEVWAGQCFARIWESVGPKRIHGFAYGGERAIMSFPFDSVDATNWELGPCKFGQWKAFGGERVSVRGSKQNLRAEVEWHLQLERRARDRWRREMEKLEELDRTSPHPRLAEARRFAYYSRFKPVSPTVELSAQPDGRDRMAANLGPPDIRLSAGGHSPDARASEALEGERPEVRLAISGKKKSDRDSNFEEPRPDIRLAADPGAASGRRIEEALSLGKDTNEQ